MKKESINKIVIVTIFAIAMGFLEAAVVIYLRKLFYPAGFHFPLASLMDSSVLRIELFRELATIVMLIAIGILAGRKTYEKLAFFLYSFAIWDIFYYIFLKITLNWPSSFKTWDLLFLIPWAWVGPVITPILCNVLMIFSSLLIINLYDKGYKVYFTFKEWALIVIGIIIVLYTWLYDYGKIIFSNNINLINKFVPVNYNWFIFLIGFVISIIGILLFYTRTKKQK